MLPLRPACALLFAAIVAAPLPAHASDHLDTPTVIADPRADIGDLYAWISPDGLRLELVMTIVGHAFSDRLTYAFHVDSGPRFGRTTATTTITCRLATPEEVECRAGHGDWARGGNTMPDGLEDRRARFRVFAGLRDDPFFNNVKGTRAAYQAAIAAVGRGAARDVAGCPAFDTAMVRAIGERWRHTEGWPAKNLLAGWTPASLVVSIDLATVARGGHMLAIWASTSDGDHRIDRAGRPLTGNALLGTSASDDVADRLKEAYNAASPSTAGRFVAEIEKNLALYDAFDGRCGNAFLADAAAGAHRYRRLARLLVDDRLWVDATSTTCAQPFAVELAVLGGRTASARDCGGRTPLYDAIDAYRSLLANGTTRGIDDGVDRDEREHSTSVFPFLAAPDGSGYSR